MGSRPSALQIGAVALAVALTGSYVWFRSARAQEQRAATADAAPATNPALVEPPLLPSSKGGLLLPTSRPSRGSTENLHYTYGYPYPNAVPGQQPTTAPSTAPRTVFFGTKSGPIDVLPQRKSESPKSEHVEVTFDKPTVSSPTTSPAKTVGTR